MVAFVQSPAPFDDFIIFIQKSNKISLSSISSNLKINGNGACLVFSGMAIINNQIIQSADELSELIRKDHINLDELILSHGFFTAVLEIEGFYYICTDRTGYGKIFVYETNDITMVSNRFHALVIAMRFLDLKRMPDYAVIASSLLTTDSAFENAISERTFLENISLVKLDHFLEIRDKKINFKKNLVMEEAFSGVKLSKRQYRAELLDGVEEVVNRISLLSESTLFSAKRIGLTGGRDSRVIYAAILRSGNINDYSMETYPPDSEDTKTDFDISLNLTSAFGGKYWAIDDRTRYGITAKIAVSAMISFQAGENRAIATNTTPSIGAANSSMKLIGAGGEYFRALYWTQHNYQAIYDALNPSNFYDKIFRSKVDLSSLPSEIANDAIENYRNTLISLPGDDPRIKPENFFAYYKNRCHFGHRNLTSFFGSIYWSPLDSIHLIRATRSLPFEEFSSSYGPAEILFSTAPALAYIDFNGEPLSDELLSRNPLYHAKSLLSKCFKDQVDLGIKHKEWQSAEESLKASAEIQYSKIKYENWNAIVEELKVLGLKYCDDLRQYSEKFDDIFSSKMLSNFASETSRSNGPWMLLAAKIIEVHDALIDDAKYGYGCENLKIFGEGYVENPFDLMQVIIL